MLENLEKIKVEKPVDLIIRQVKGLISTGVLKPGESLPPERKLSEHLGVGRSQVREAIKKLEFYGILKTMPQSGTYVAGIGIVALEGLISDVLELEPNDLNSLIETRILLEIHSAKKAALLRTKDDIIHLQNALDAYEKKRAENDPAEEEDLLFHIKIAEASKNPVLKSMLMIITPDILKNYKAYKICSDLIKDKTIVEHRDILQHIIDQDGDAASKSMEKHLADVLTFSNSYKSQS